MRPPLSSVIDFVEIDVLHRTVRRCICAIALKGVILEIERYHLGIGGMA